jgi:hypothetical protein
MIASSFLIIGHGIKVEEECAIARGLIVSPIAPVIDSSFGSRTVGELRNAINIMALENLADFSIKVEEECGAPDLAAKAWNALWVFHLLSLACRRPVMPLYSVPSAGGQRFTLANRNIVIHRLPTTGLVSSSDLGWARDHFEQFDHLIGDARFAGAMRAYGNAHYLFDDDAKIMLLWAGIEGLLGVDAELRRRIALHAAILYDGSADKKIAYFSRIKKGYDIRSKVVHGAKISADALKIGYQLAAEVLLELLRKAVILGRVPAAAELDELAAAVSFPSSG